MPEKSPKPSLERCIDVMRTVCSIIPFAPTDDLTRQLIGTELYRTAANEAELIRLIRVAIRDARKWEGLSGLRELMANDSEREYFAEQAEQTAQLIEGYREQARTLPAHEQAANTKLIEAAKPKRLN